MTKAFGLLVALGVATLLLIAGISSYVSAKNYGVATENLLTAKLTDNQQIFGNYTAKIAELAQVPTMYKDDLKEVVTASMEGRYGEDGSKATWQWLKEQNPTLDPSMYRSIQQAMESGRNEFKISQTELLDIKRTYENQLGFVWSGFWLNLAGYPKIDLKDIKVITSTTSQEAYKTGVNDGVILRK